MSSIGLGGRSLARLRATALDLGRVPPGRRKALAFMVSGLRAGTQACALVELVSEAAANGRLPLPFRDD